MHRCLGLVLLVLALAPAPGFAEDAAEAPEVLLVLWTANDCPYCTRWKGSLGGKGELQRWSGFSRITYVEVERPSLRGTFAPEHFPAEPPWLAGTAMRHASGMVPAWSIFVGRKHVLSGAGMRAWDTQVFPALKERAAGQRAPQS